MNIQLREADEWSNYSKEIVQWYNNPDYWQDYSMYEVRDWMVILSDNYRKPESLYKTKRLCQVIAFVHWKSAISMVWDRYLDLDEEDKKEFDKIRRELLWE